MTEPNDPEAQYSGPIVVNDNVELPQFEVVRNAARPCDKHYHQKSGWAFVRVVEALGQGRREG